MGFRGWFTNNSHTAYYYMEKAAKATNNPRAESRAYFYIGRTALEEQKYSRAIENLEKATELDYSFSKAWSNLSTAYLSVGKTNEAKTACERGLLYSPQDPYLNSKIGDYYFSTGNYERALSAFSVTERALPKNSTAVMNMALAYAGLGDEENAKAKFNRAKMLGYDGSDSAWSQISILLSQNSVQTYDKVVHTGVFVLESSCDCIEDCTRSDVERFLENAFESEDDFILLTPPEAIQGVQFIQACGSDFGGFVQISVEQLDGRCILFERECEQSEIERMFLDLFDYKIIPDLSKFN